MSSWSLLCCSLKLHWKPQLPPTPSPPPPVPSPLVEINRTFLWWWSTWHKFCLTLNPFPVHSLINLVPRAFSSFKMAVGETPGQGCWNTPRIVEYFVTWHTIKWLFWMLFPVSGGPFCFLQSETVVQTKRIHFIVFAWRNSNELLEPLRQPWPGVSPTAILKEEKALGTRL